MRGRAGRGVNSESVFGLLRRNYALFFTVHCLSFVAFVVTGGHYCV